MMSIFSIFGRNKHLKNKMEFLEANATLYPDKILIETTDRVKEGFGISSMKLTILPVNTDNQNLGSTLRYHLNLSRSDLKIPKDYKEHYKNFLVRAGFKNGKEHHRNALNLAISQKQNLITISPSKNGGYTGKERGFHGIKDTDIIVGSDIDNFTLGSK
jgi:hypothetical protein